MIGDVEHTYIGIATVIAALGSATASIIAALNARTGKRIEAQLKQANGHANGKHEGEET